MRKYVIILSILLFAISCTSLTERMDSYAVHGIDVSHHQSHIDWETVASSDQIDFVFVKATEGLTFSDSLFCANWENIQKVNLLRGAYHFFRPNVSGVWQAKHFIQNVEMEAGDLPPVLDIETTDNIPKKEMIKKIAVWLETVEDHYKIRPIIYTNLKFHQKYIAGNFDEYPLWIARYSPYKPTLNFGQSWSFWQYGNKGRMDGINGDVDFNVFHGPKEDLLKMTYHWKPQYSFIDLELN